MNFEVINHDKYHNIKSKVEKLDTNFAPELKSQFVLFNQENPKNVVVDLSETNYCDSSGLSALLVGNRLAKENNTQFVIVGTQPNVQKLIEISQLHRVFVIVPTLSEAEDYIFMSEIENELDVDVDSPSNS